MMFLILYNIFLTVIYPERLFSAFFNRVIEVHIPKINIT